MLKIFIKEYKKWQRNRLNKHYLAIQETKAQTVNHLIDYERLHKEEGFTEEQARSVKKPESEFLGASLVVNLKFYWGVYNNTRVLTEANNILKESIVEAEKKLGYQFDNREETFAMLDKI